MLYSSTTYATPPRPAFPLHQAHPYHAQTPPSSTRSPYKDDSPRGPRHAAASLDRPNKISYLLLPLVSKFEALDALSSEMKIPSLRPAPLQVTRNLSLRRGGLDGPTSVKLEAIFSPRKKSRSRYGDACLEAMVASPTENVYTTGTTRRSVMGRLKQTESSDKVKAISIPEKTGLADQMGDRNKMRRQARENNTVRARIRFFDGSIEGTSVSIPSPCLYDTNTADGSPYSALSTAPTANAKPSLRQSIIRKLPTSHKSTYLRQTITQQPPSPSTTGALKFETKCAFNNRGSPQTPTRVGTTSGSTLRQYVSNPFLQASHSNPPTRQVSPKSFIGKVLDKSGYIGRPLYETSRVPDPIKKDASTEDRRVRARPQQPPVQRANPGPQIKRKTSAKHEAVDGAESLEGSDTKKIIRPDPKDQGKKMLREKGEVVKPLDSGPWSLSKAAGTRIPRPIWRDFSNPAPSAPPWSSIRRHSTAVSRTSKKSPQMVANQIPSLKLPDHRCLSSPTKATCKGIHEKIKGWESRAKARDERREEPEMYSSHGKLHNAKFKRNSIFKNPWNNEAGNLQNRGLDGQEARSVVQEFQDIGEELDGATKGEHKLVLTSQLGRAGATAQNESETEDGSVDMGTRIIVREAHCGLAEPKPLRLLEMKRMLILCRERGPAGSPTKREGGGG